MRNLWIMWTAVLLLFLLTAAMVANEPVRRCVVEIGGAMVEHGQITSLDRVCYESMEME